MGEEDTAPLFQGPLLLVCATQPPTGRFQPHEVNDKVQPAACLVPGARLCPRIWGAGDWPLALLLT